MKIVMIGHRARMGKDTFAKMLKGQFENSGMSAEIASFATPIKEIMAEALGVSVEVLEVMKNDSEYYRGILQRFGSGKMKEFFGDDVWRSLMLQEIEGFREKSVDVVIIPDFRFPSEFIHGATTINVVKYHPDEPPIFEGMHISETAMDVYDYFIVVDNCGTLDELEDEASFVKKEILEMEDD